MTNSSSRYIQEYRIYLEYSCLRCTHCNRVDVTTDFGGLFVCEACGQQHRAHQNWDTGQVEMNVCV